MSKPTEKFKVMDVSENHHFPNTTNLSEIIFFLQSLKDRGFTIIDRDQFNYWSERDINLWDFDFTFRQVREETDEEFEERVRQWQEEQKAERERKKKYKAEREERERKEYERLSKKFGVTNEQ